MLALHFAGGGHNDAWMALLVMSALALGATAVLIGRPYCYGLAIAGESGVREVIQNFIGDFDLTLGLSGCAAVAEIGSELVEIA